MPDFTSTSLALSQAGLDAAAAALGTGLPEIWSVFTVETKGCGFLPDRRPVILYERHIFHKLTNGAYDDGDISDPSPGGYGALGAHQYDRLNQAIALNRAAALQSASWGLGQIMGENFAGVGFASVDDMVSAMCDSEDIQLQAVTAFLQANRLDVALRNHDWAGLARGYNGPNYAINQYDTRLAAAFASMSAGAVPDLTVRTAQLYLTFRGFNTGGVDGLNGKHTRDALSAFQTSAGLPVTGSPGDATLAALTPA